MKPASTHVTFAVAVISAIAFVQTGLCLVSTWIQTRDLPQYGLTLIGPMDANFENQVNAALAGRRSPSTESAKPYSVLLVNNSGVDVVAYCVRWDWISSAGKKVGRIVVFDDLDNEGPSVLIPSGFVGFISPVYSKIASQNQTLSRSALAALEQMASVADMTVTLDGVFLANGTFVGPDQSSSYANEMAVITARNAVFKEVISRHATGQSDDEVLAWLQSVALAPPSESRAMPVVLALSARQRVARTMISEFQTIGSNRAVDEASRMLTLQGRVFSKVPYSK